MTIVGRLTRDSVVNTLGDERIVVNFSLAVNDSSYSKTKGERRRWTAFFNCAYWRSDRIAPHLRKGVLVQVEGRVFAEAYIGSDGTAKASLNCHVHQIKLLTGAKEVEVIGRPADTEKDGADDIPF